MNEILDVEEAPDRVQKYTWDAEDSDFAFICPRCQHKNLLSGEPMNFANKPFRCLNCNYVPLLGKEELQEFVGDDE